MTEAEAKTKWCPAAVASHTDPRGGFREDDKPDAYKIHPCIGSACMAWRWAVMSAAGSGFKPCASKMRADLLSGENPDLITVGFCGLAGKP